MIKKLLFLYFSIMVLAPAVAAVRCVNSGILTENDGMHNYYKIDWQWSQEDEDAVPFYGVSVCSEMDPMDNVGATAVYVPQSSTTSLNDYCYCRLVAPVVTPWIALGIVTNCYQNCSSLCAGRDGLENINWKEYL